MGNCFSSNKEIPASSMDPPSNILRICNQELEKIIKILVQIRFVNPFYETLLIFFDNLYQNMKNYSGRSENNKRLENFPIYSFKLQEISNILIQNHDNPELNQTKILIFISYLEEFYKLITSSDFTFKTPFTFKNPDLSNQSQTYTSFHNVEIFLNESEIYLEKQLFPNLFPDGDIGKAKQAKFRCVQALGLWFQVFERRKFIFWYEFPKFIREVFERSFGAANLNDDKVNLMREYVDSGENQVIKVQIWERFFWEWLLVAGRRRELFSNRPQKRLLLGIASRGKKLELIERKRENVEGSLLVNNKIIIDNKGFRLYGQNKTRRDLFTNFISFGEGGCDFPVTMKRNVGIVAILFLKNLEPDNFYLLNISCKMHVKILLKSNDLKEEELYFCEGQYFRRKNDGKNLEFYEVANSEIKTINTINERKFDWKKKVVWRLLGNYEEFMKSLDDDGKSGFVFAKAYKLQEGDVININDFVFKYGENTDDLDKERRFESEKQQKKPDEIKLTDTYQTPNIIESVVVRSLLDRNDSKSEMNSFGNVTDLKVVENITENQENRSHSENLPNKPVKSELANLERPAKYKYDGSIEDEKVNESKGKVVKTISSLEFFSQKEKINDSKPEIALIVSNSNENFEENKEKIEELPLCRYPDELNNLVKNSNEYFELIEQKIEEAPLCRHPEELKNLVKNSNENFELIKQKLEGPPAKVNEHKENVEETLIRLDFASQKQKQNDLHPEIAQFASSLNKNSELNVEKIVEIPLTKNPADLHNSIPTSNENIELNDQKIEKSPPNHNQEDLQHLDPDPLNDKKDNINSTQPDSHQIAEQELLDKHPNYETSREEQPKEPLQITEEAEPEPEFTEIPIQITHFQPTPPLNLIQEIEHKKPRYTGRYADISTIYPKKRVSVHQKGLAADLVRKLQRQASTPTLPKTALVTNIFKNMIHKTIEKENEKKRIEDLVRFSCLDLEEANKRRKSSTVVLLSGKVVSEKLVEKIYILEELNGGVYPSTFKTKKEEVEPQKEPEFLTDNRPRRKNVKKRKNNLEFIAEEEI